MRELEPMGKRLPYADIDVLQRAVVGSVENRTGVLLAADHGRR